MGDLHHLHREPPPAWNSPAAYEPEAIQRIRDRLNGKPRHVTVRPSWFAELRQDASDIISDVRASPYSHALVALLTIVGWTALLVAPLLIGAGK